jgi:hypothetical protein
MLFLYHRHIFHDIKQIAGRSDETLPVDSAPSAKIINDWIAVYSLPLVVPFSQVRFPALLIGLEMLFDPLLTRLPGHPERHLRLPC